MVFTRKRLGCLLRLGGSLLIVGLLLAAVVILLIPAEDRIETAWEQPPPVATGIAATGRVLVDVGFVRGRGGNGQFVIEPVAAGEPVRVVAVFDQRAYVLEHGFVDDGEPGWTFRLRFTRRRWFPLNPHQYPQEVRLQLPRGVPLRIEGRVAWGESDLKLGGLSLLSLDWDVALGSHEISFAEPLGVPFERLAVTSRVGSLQVRGLGRASPRSVELEHAIGDLAIDLEGGWANDATIRAGCTAAKCVVRAPDGAALVLPDGSEWTETVAPLPPGDLPRPRLSFTPVKRLGGFSLGRGASVDVGADDP